MQPSDLTPFDIVAPLDPRLPGGGGYLVTGLYDVVPAKAGQVNNLVVDSVPYGKWYPVLQWPRRHDQCPRRPESHGDGRDEHGPTVADNCDVRRHLPELATTATAASGFGAGLNTSVVTMASPYCHVAYGVLTQIEGLASYEVPKIGVLLAATFQSKPRRCWRPTMRRRTRLSRLHSAGSLGQCRQRDC